MSPCRANERCFAESPFVHKKKKGACPSFSFVPIMSQDVSCVILVSFRDYVCVYPNTVYCLFNILRDTALVGRVVYFDLA